jgi:hypothetical protein
MKRFGWRGFDEEGWRRGEGVTSERLVVSVEIKQIYQCYVTTRTTTDFVFCV